MDLLQGLLVIGAIHLLAAASPGPDFVLVSQQTLMNCRKAGYLCSIGIMLGLSIHITYSIFGLAAIIANSTTALWTIKILGGGYLIYLGIKGLKAGTISDSMDRKEVIRQAPAMRLIGLGVLCNALNPKAPIYFVAVFTVVLSPNMPLQQLAIYGVWMMFIQLAWFATVVTLLSQPRIQQKLAKFGHWFDRVLGGAMVAMGLKVIVTQ